ncbi:MAG: hypothetical protein ACP5KW_11915 [Thermoproteota archaeon]
MTNCKFIVNEEDHDFLVCRNTCEDFCEGYEKYFHKYPVKTQDGRELGLMYTHKDLYMVYFDEKRMIKWPDDWVDPYPSSIESVYVFNDHIKIWKSHEVDLDFMCHAYYNVYINANYFLNREDRMRVAEFVPAVVKDFNVFLKLSDEVCNKYKLDKFVIDMPNVLGCIAWFDTTNLSDEEVIDKVIRGTTALTELRRKFREWLPSDERKEYYENTMLYPEDPFRERTVINNITKWPFKGGSPSEDIEHERSIKVMSWYNTFFYHSKNLKSLRKHYSFDGYRLRLARKTENNLEFLGKVVEGEVIVYDEIKEEDLTREDIVIAVDKKMKRLPKFPLEKIEFLKEDFPEMFK